VYRMRGKHDLAAAAAAEWRRRTPDNPKAADFLLAEIELARSNPAGAIDALKNYQSQFKTNPRDNATGVALLARAYAMDKRAKEAHDLLHPLLPNDASWRVTWLRIAGLYIPDTNAAAKWIDEVKPMLVDDVEQLALADAWYQLAVRGASGGALENAAKALDPLIAKPQPPADATALRAIIADRAGDTKTAEVNYRRTIKLKPNHADAMNNLAYLLLQVGGDMNDAKTFAAKAVELQPANTDFLDTLARVQLKAGDRDGAVATFQRALNVQPNKLEVLVGLAGTLLAAGERDTAAPLLVRIDEALKTNPRISAQLQREVDAVRASARTSL
jgi:Flp pilus assembly protein TadD